MREQGLIAESFKGKSAKEIFLDGWPTRKRSLILRAIFIAVYAAFLIAWLSHPGNYHIYTLSGYDAEGFNAAKAILIPAALVAMMFVSATPNILSPKANRVVLILAVLLIPGLIFCATGAAFGTDFFEIRKLFLGLNVMIVYLLCILGALVTGYIRTGLFAGSGLVCAFSYISYYAYMMRGTPLLYSDFSNFGTGANMLSNFDYSLNYNGFMFMVIMFTIFVVISKLPLNKPLGGKSRVALALAFCVCWGGLIYASVFANAGPLSVVKNSFSFNPLRHGYNANGALLAIVRSAKISLVKKPAGYSSKAAETLMDGISDALKTEHPEKPKEEYRRPNVIAIMNESFSDVANIGEHIETNKDPLPFWHGLKEDTIKGYAYASVFGGGTANTEFEFLTGNSMAFLPVNASPYQLYMKQAQPSLVSTLKAQGYQGNVAVHPYRKDGYSRPRAYELLGFSRFLGQNSFSDPKMLRRYISDEADYDKLISLYESYKKKSDAPIFLWTVTMQNHVGYREDYPNFTPDVHASGLSEDEQGEYNQVDKLLSLTHESDRAVGELVEYFRRADDPTVIIFFGDHQPQLPQAYYDKVLDMDGGGPDEIMKKYRVPFFIWANFDIEEKEIERVSVNYLSSLALGAVGMEMTDYNEYLLGLYEEVPCVTVYGHYDSAGAYFNTEAKTQNDPNARRGVIEATSDSSPQDEALREYNVIEYNNLFDPKHRMDSFFYLNKNGDG
ncbi:MAG: LTA synthase family protein [Clostridiales Family XIII bacterium]|jgi:phosphoglycerol transferase MdoB-like AlkP superfamily enzyme|nr:LTA synthase family protein [Clostridiales Family XIII bacterium]